MPVSTCVPLFTASCKNTAHRVTVRQAFDTADAYTAGGSERILGKFLKKYSIPRESVVILTKTYFPGWSPDSFANNSGLSRKVNRPSGYVDKFGLTCTCLW